MAYPERVQFLEDNSDKMESTMYFRPLSQDDLDAKRELLADNAIKLDELNDEKKAANDEFKGKMNPIIHKNKALLKEIKSRQEEVNGTIFHVANHDSGFMETYDCEGDIIATRKLRPGERQSSIFNVAAKAK